jgi:SAM-dependent methyltransferase
MAPGIDEPDLADYYERPDVVHSYIQDRFSDPVGRLLHENQVARLNALIRDAGVETALEIAPGPARLTAEVRGIRAGVALDTSPEMLAAAAGRLRTAEVPWSLIRGSAFAIPLGDSTIPFAYSLRFLRHLREGSRARVLAEVRRVLRPGGTYLFDAPPARVERLDRSLVGYDPFPVYDELWTRQGLVGELERAGFRVDAMEGNVQHFFTQSLLGKLSSRFGVPRMGDASVRALESLNVGEPFEWLVVCAPE